MTTTTHDRRTRPTDAAPDRHDKRTCPTCRERPLTENELVEAYGIRNHDALPPCKECGEAQAAPQHTSPPCRDCASDDDAAEPKGGIL